MKRIDNAGRLGPWEWGIQRMVLEVGLNKWLVFSKSERSFVLETISHALEKQTREILEIVNKHGLLDIICLLNKEKPDVVKYFDKYKKVKPK